MKFGFLATERVQVHVIQKNNMENALIFMWKSKPFHGFEVKVKLLLKPRPLNQLLLSN